MGRAAPLAEPRVGDPWRRTSTPVGRVYSACSVLCIASPPASRRRAPGSAPKRARRASEMSRDGAASRVSGGPPKRPSTPSTKRDPERARREAGANCLKDGSGRLVLQEERKGDYGLTSTMTLSCSCSCSCSCGQSQCEWFPSWTQTAPWQGAAGRSVTASRSWTTHPAAATDTPTNAASRVIFRICRSPDVQTNVQTNVVTRFPERKVGAGQPV
jgi:hypothetical protein